MIVDGNGAQTADPWVKSSESLTHNHPGLDFQINNFRYWYPWKCGWLMQRACMYLILSTINKCFTNVTKTFANLTTYSRKPGDYNGTIIFEIDIMKKSSPINLNLCQTWLFHNFFGCFFCFVYSEAELRVLLVQQKRSVILVLTWQKNVNFRLSGDEFFMISISKIIVPL